MNWLVLEDLYEEDNCCGDDNESYGYVCGLVEGLCWEDVEVEVKNGYFCEVESDEVEGFVDVEDLGFGGELSVFFLGGWLLILFIFRFLIIIFGFMY